MREGKFVNDVSCDKICIAFLLFYNDHLQHVLQHAFANASFHNYCSSEREFQIKTTEKRSNWL